jgi:K+-transporting ATPase A subunit
LSIPLDLAFNTAVSFTTNTNWQAYAGETTMSYFTQMAGLAYRNFVSAAAPWTHTPRADSSDFSARHASTFSNSIWRSTRSGR